MSRCIKILGVTILCLTAFPALAGVDVEQALESFHSTCLAHGPDFDRTTAAADGLGWEPIAEDAFAKLAPLENARAMRGWRATGKAMPEGTVVGVSKATLNGKAVQTCTVAIVDVHVESFLKSFFTRTDAEKISEERNEVQVSRLYILIAGDRKQFVNLKFPASTGEGMIVASSITGE
ncbi:hypothetical protein [Mesorhizobium sp. AA22]|uniref:hypothetical protein n=1 Tax=Mesorhizobium sp. AA22 TaxID=1854057 RepID=UPI000FE5C713|nr:hypothetical protein [Mesorhizobium sp. AA22]QIA21988.1 hypothetical protein A9K68_009385 [Mesorhizobium sp. AA22]RWC38672.1 MAG: hypothetical protein EOS28_29265 [Mesorhizobium sp.]